MNEEERDEKRKNINKLQLQKFNSIFGLEKDFPCQVVDSDEMKDDEEEKQKRKKNTIYESKKLRRNKRRSKWKSAKTRQ